MSDRFRNKVVSQLAEEINHLSGGSFEQFGYKVMPLVQRGHWLERGTTMDGAPRGGTVDTSLAGSAYVGEMSSSAEYFEGNLSKLKKDLKHAAKVHPHAKHLWLLSARTASASQITAVEKVIAAFKASHPSLESLSILDARQIAARIFEHLAKHDLVRDLAHYLPGLTKLAEEHAFSDSIPPIDSYAPRSSVEASIVEALESWPYVILRGMSGIGKTALAARIAHLHGVQFDNRIWLDAREIDGTQKLRSICLTRSGLSHNILGLIRNERMLVVIDDPAFSLSELASLEYGESKVIVTAQVASGEHVLEVVDLDPKEAQTVLTAEVGQPCPPNILAHVLDAAGGHPLLIRALNRLALEKGWNAVDDCVATASLSELEDDKNQNIFRRVLRKHTELAYELQFVRWIGSGYFAEEFARAASSILVEKLHRRGFLAATSVGHVRIHDLVYNAIQTDVTVEQNTELRLRQRISAFIRAESETDRQLLQHLARVHSELFARIASKDRQPEFIYMVAMNRTSADAILLLGDPVAMVMKLSHLASLRDNTLEIRAVIEAVEALYTLRDTHLSKDEARSKLGADIEALATLLNCPGISAEQRSMLQYHHAKMLLRLDAKGEVAGRDQAVSIFYDILAQDPSRTAARNQLAKILGPAASIEQCELVLARHVKEPGSVNWNVVLDSFRLLVRHGAPMAKHENLLLTTIEYAKSINSTQAIRLVASVGQRAWFSAPQLLVPMFVALGAAKDEGTPSDAFDLAQVHKFASLESDDSTRGKLLTEALRLYEESRPNIEYQITHYAEALLLTGRYQQARNVLATAPSGKRSAYWWQREGEARSAMGDHKGGLTAIDNAIESIPEPSLLPDFYRSRFRIRRSAGSEDSRTDLEHAITMLPDAHPFRRKLENDLRLILH